MTFKIFYKWFEDYEDWKNVPHEYRVMRARQTLMLRLDESFPSEYCPVILFFEDGKISQKLRLGSMWFIDTLQLYIENHYYQGHHEVELNIIDKWGSLKGDLELRYFVLEYYSAYKHPDQFMYFLVKRKDFKSCAII